MVTHAELPALYSGAREEGLLGHELLGAEKSCPEVKGDSRSCYQPAGLKGPKMVTHMGDFTQGVE